MTLVKRKGGGCLLTCLTFKFRRHCCQVLCSTFCPMRDQEGWVCAIFNSLFGKSLEESYFGWMRTHKNSSPTVQRVLIVILWCIVHQSKSSIGSAACVYVVQNNKSWGSRHCCIRHNEHWDLLQQYEIVLLSLWQLLRKSVRKHIQITPSPTTRHTHTHSRGSQTH